MFGVTKIVNFAHGEFLMLGMYAAYVGYAAFHASPYLTMFLIGPLFFAIGAAFYSLLLRPLGAHEERQILVTVGASLVLQNLALALFKPEVRTVESPLHDSWQLGAISLSTPRLVAAVASLLLTSALLWLLHRTRLGIAVRACADEPEVAMSVGIPVDRINAISFGLGTACAALGGALILPFYPASPYVGLTFTLTCFVIIVFGGMGSFAGALLAAFAVGVIESVTELLVSPALRQLGSFALFAVFLAVRPTGLFGRRQSWLTT